MAEKSVPEAPREACSRPVKLANMQPYFLPYIGYWQLVNAVDIFVIYDSGYYLPGGWINRNRILVQGKPHLFTIDLAHKSAEKRISELELAPDPKNRKQFLMTLRCNYSRTPFFKERFAFIEDIVNFPETNLARFLENSLRKMTEYLGMSARFISGLPPKPDGKPCQDDIIDICREYGASTYVNPVNGQAFYSREAFAAAGIELRFIRNLAKPYQQFKYDFAENLSIIDVLMYNSNETIREMLGAYELF